MSHSPASPSSAPAKGILRNNSVKVSLKDLELVKAEKLDRKKVLENTRLNAQIHKDTEENTEGDKIRKQLAEKRLREGRRPSEEHLLWDEVNLYLTEQEKSATMKIDEPKTPYEGGVDPNNEYYRSDDEDDLDDFALGEPLLELQPEGVEESLNGGEIIKEDNSEEEDEEEEAPRLSAEERHRLFEEKRKNHYHLKLEVLKHPVPIDDDEEEEK